MCVFHKIKKTVLLLITGVGVINVVSAQLVYKVGDNPFSIDSKAALEVASTKGGFLPPRMSKVQRNGVISSAPADKDEGLIVWCNDCKSISTNPSGELCVYLVKKSNPLVTTWVSFTVSTIPGLTTGKETDSNKPVKVSATSVTIKGTLVDFYGIAPTEAGVVWREVINKDTTTLPVLDDSGGAIPPNYKKAMLPLLLSNGGIDISVTISGLTSGSSYIFSTYAKSPSGIGYGNPVIYKLDP